MNNIEKYSIILQLLQKLRSAGSWGGETHLQKSMYFLQTASAVPTNFNFMLYKHGPFSFDFRDALSEMRTLGLLDLELVPPYGPRYKITQHGEKFLSNNQEGIVPWSDKIETIANCLGDKKVQQLEKLGTALLLTDKGLVDVEERADQLHKIKPHIPKLDAVAAVEELDRILPRLTSV